MVKLYVNVDHVATLRQARRTIEPDPVAAAVLAELAGADGITIHLREDRRHIQDRDLRLMKEMVKTRLNLEMAAVPEMVDIALRIRPDQVTLVPENREELTTEGGLDVSGNRENLEAPVEELKGAGVIVSLFIDPHEDQIEASSGLGVQAMEINTAAYSEAATPVESESEYLRIARAVKLGLSCGMMVHAGHGLTYKNVGRIATIPGINDFNIGHNIVARAVLVGFERAVREMFEALKSGRSGNAER
jgi:pyridoxine 5-phosphate synthase